MPDDQVLNRYDQLERANQSICDDLNRLTSVIRDGMAMFPQAQRISSPWTQRLTNSAARLRDRRFNIAVMGTFKAGKSTFINALVGANILPQKVSECTA